MSDHLRRYTSLLVCLSLLLTGCTSIEMRQRKLREGGEWAQFKLNATWDDLGGDSHNLAGLRVTLEPLSDSTDSNRWEAISTPSGPLVFWDIEPGRYTLTIEDENREYVSEKITLRPGRLLNVRVKANGRAVREMAVGAAEGLGKAFVIVGTAAIVIGLIWLDTEFCEEEETTPISVNIRISD